MGIFSFESFALAVLVVALAAFLAWRQMREAAELLEELRDQREEGKNIIRFSDPSTIIIKDYQDAMAKYNDTEHEQPCASMEPMCGAANPTNLEAVNREISEMERQARSRRAIRRAQQAAYESKTNSAKERDEFIPVISAWGNSGFPAASDSTSSSSKFSGSGGSFDGGGASGDWGGSSSSSSSSSDCSSSSSDSGSSSCSSSD